MDMAHAPAAPHLVGPFRRPVTGAAGRTPLRRVFLRLVEALAMRAHTTLRVLGVVEPLARVPVLMTMTGVRWDVREAVPLFNHIGQDVLAILSNVDMIAAFHKGVT